MAATAPVVLLHDCERPVLPRSPLDLRMTRARDALSDVLMEVNTSGILMDPPLLRRLRTCALEALQVATLYKRHGGACGYGCPRPGLHCAVTEGPLRTVTEPLVLDGFIPGPHDLSDAAQICVCGAPMVRRTLRRGSDIRAWATCEWCEHWLALGV